VVSLATPKPSPEQVEGLTWKNPLQVIAGGRIKSKADPRLWAGLLLLTMVVLYYIFH